MGPSAFRPIDHNHQYPPSARTVSGRASAVCTAASISLNDVSLNLRCSNSFISEFHINEGSWSRWLT